MTIPSCKIVHSHVDGTGAVFDALAERQLDPPTFPAKEWSQLTRKQQKRIIDAFNRERFADTGPEVLSLALEFADAVYSRLTSDRRKNVLHPRHVRDWLSSRQVCYVIDNRGEPPPHLYALESDSILDTGPQPAIRGVYVTVAINAEATTSEIKQAIEALLDNFHPTALRLPKKLPKDGKTALRRERAARLKDEEVALALRWYYELAKGEPPVSIAKRLAGKPTPDHIGPADRRIRDYVQWLERELGLPRHSLWAIRNVVATQRPAKSARP